MDIEWLRNVKEGDYVCYLLNESTSRGEKCVVTKASLKFLYVKGLRFSRQTGFLSGSDRASKDVRLGQIKK